MSAINELSRRSTFGLLMTSMIQTHWIDRKASPHVNAFSLPGQKVIVLTGATLGGECESTPSGGSLLAPH